MILAILLVLTILVLLALVVTVARIRRHDIGFLKEDEPTYYSVKVTKSKSWIVYVKTSDRFAAEEHACDILEENLGNSYIEEWDSVVLERINSEDEIPQNSPRFPQG